MTNMFSAMEAGYIPGDLRAFKKNAVGKITYHKVVVDIVEGVGHAAEATANWVINEVVNPVAHVVETVVQAAVDNPVKTIAQIAAVATGNAWALPLIDGADVLAKGGNLEDAFKAAAISYVTAEVSQGASKAVGSEVASATGSQTAGQIIGNAAGSASVAIITGQDPVKAFVNGGISAGVGATLGQVDQATGGKFSQLPKTVQAGIQSAITAHLTHNPNPSAAVVGSMISASGYVTDAVSSFDPDGTKLTTTQRAILVDVLTNTAIAAATGGNPATAIQSALQKAGTKALSDATSDAFKNSTTTMDTAYEKVRSLASQLDTNETSQGNIVTAYNSLANELQGKINQQNSLETAYKNAVATHNAAPSEATANAANTAIAAFNTYATNLAQEYTNKYKPRLDSYLTDLNTLKATNTTLTSQLQGASTTFTQSASGVSDLVESITLNTNKTYAEAIDPNFNAEEYKKTNGLSDTEDPYVHFLTRGQFNTDISKEYKLAFGKDPTVAELNLINKNVANEGFESVRGDIQRAKVFPDYETSVHYGGDISAYNAVIDPIKTEYQKQLGRDVTPEELKTLVNAVENVGYPAVVRGIADSSEAKNYKASTGGIDADTLEANKPQTNQQIKDWFARSPVVKESWSQMPTLKPGEDMTTLIKSAPKSVTDALNKDLIKNSSDFTTAYEMARVAYGGNKTFEWTNPNTGKTSTFSTNTKQEVALQPFDATSMSRSGLGGAAQAALNAGKTSFTWVDGSIYKVPDAFAFLKGPDQSSAENKRLLEAGVVPVKSNGQTFIDQIIATGKAGLGDQLQAYGNAIALATGTSFNNAMINIGAVIEQQGKNQDLPSIKAQEANIDAALNSAKNPNISWFDSVKIVAKAGYDNPIAMMSYAGREIAQEGLPKLAGTAAGLVIVGAGAVLGAPVATTAGGALLVARGVSAVMDGLESFGSNGAEAYKTLKAANVPEEQARTKALWVGATSAAITIPAEFIADKALFSHYIGSIQGGVKEYAAKYGSTVATQMLSEGLESAGENAILQYTTTGKIGVNEALSNGMFGAMIATGTTGGMLVPSGIRDTAVIGKDIYGKSITFAESLSGAKTLDLKTLDTNAVIGKSVGGTDITLGSLSAIGLDAGLDVNMLSSVLPPSMVSSTLVVGTDSDGVKHTFGEIQRIQATQSPANAELFVDNLFDDAHYVTQAEVKQIYTDAGVTAPTPEQISKYVGKRNEAATLEVVTTNADVIVSLRDAGVPAGKIAGLADQATEIITSGKNPIEVAHDLLDIFDANNVDAAKANTMTANYSGLITTEQIDNAIQKALAKNPSATAEDVQTAIRNEVKDFATLAEVKAAIKDIKFPAGLTATDVTNSIKTYMEAHPGLSLADVSSKITDATKGLATTTGVQTSLTNALKGYATTKDIQEAIKGIEFPVGLTTADVTKSIKTYMEAHPGLSLADVSSKITDATKGLATTTGVQTALTNALKGYATTKDIQEAIQNIKFPAGLTAADVTKSIKTYMEANPGLSLADVSSKITEATKGLATTTGVQTALTNALKGVATTQDIKTAIAGIKFPAGLTADDVTKSIKTYMEAHPGLSLADVSSKITDATKGLATTTGVQTAITNALKGVATKTDINTAIQNIKFPVGLTKADVAAEIKTAMDAHPGITAEQVATEISTYFENNPNLTLAEVKTAISAATKNMATTTDILNLKSDLSKKIDAAIKAGANGDIALQQGIDSLATDLGTTKESILKKLGTTETNLKSDFAVKLAKLETTFSLAITEAMEAGAAGDAALSDAIDQIATDLGTTKDALLKQIGTTESALSKQFTAKISGLDTKLSTAIADVKATGLAGNKALQEAISKVATDMGTTKTDLLAKMGATADDLKTQFTDQLSTLEDNLSDEIDAAIKAGAAGDAALQKGIDSLATKMGVNQTALLTAMGKSTDTLKNQFTKQLTNLDTKLSTAIAEAQAAGLAGDEALQKAIAQVATDVGTTKDDLLVRMGTTEANLKTQFTNQLTSLDEKLSLAIADAQAAGLRGDEALQKAIAQVATDVGTTKDDLLVRMGTTEANLKTLFTTQIANLDEKFSQAIADAQAAGLKGDAALSAAIDKVSADMGTTKADLLTQLGTTEANLKTQFTNQLSTISQDLQAKYDSLSADQKILADQLTQQGIDLSAAITQAQQQTTTQITGVSQDLQNKFNSLTKAQQDLALQLQQQGVDLNAAITQAQTQTATQITGVTQDLQTKFDTLTKADQNLVTQLTQQGIDLNTAINQVKTQSADQYTNLTNLLTSNQAATQKRIDDEAIAAKARSDAAEAAAAERNNALVKAGAAQATKTQRNTNLNNLMNMLGQAEDVAGQQVTVKGVDPAKIGYVYDWNSIFANPAQQNMFVSPYAKGGMVNGVDEVNDELLNILKG